MAQMRETTQSANQACALIFDLLFLFPFLFKQALTTPSAAFISYSLPLGVESGGGYVQQQLQQLHRHQQQQRNKMVLCFVVIVQPCSLCVAGFENVRFARVSETLCSAQSFFLNQSLHLI